jgi:GT2 family glycosyltransferase
MTGRAAIIIPCVRLTPRLEETVASARSELRADDEIVIVVDGGEHPPPTDIGGATIIGKRRQGGFASACTAGADAVLDAMDNTASSLALVFVNDDAILPDGWRTDIDVLQDDRVGAVGWKVTGPLGDRQTYDCQPWQAEEIASNNQFQSHVRATLAGCGFGIRIDKWNQAGGLDTRFGMYGEETDLFLTLQRSGHLLLESSNIMWHEGEGSMSKRRNRATLYGIRNPIWVAILQLRPRQIIRTIGVTVIDAIDPRGLPVDAEPHRRRRRSAPWLIRVSILIGAMCQTLLFIPSLLKGRRVRFARINALNR